MLNKITVMGRLTKDPDIRYTQNQKPVASWTLAIDRDYQSGGTERQTDFVNCLIWNQGAEFVGRNFKKGQMMALTGRLQSRKWEDRDGKKHVEYEILADNIYFCGDKPKETFEELPDDGEIPF